MKKLILFELFALVLATGFGSSSQAESLCVNKGANPTSSGALVSEVCNEKVSQSCFKDYRLSGMDVETAEQVCFQVSDICYEDAMKSNYTVLDATKTCRGKIIGPCYDDARIHGMSVSDAVELCQEK